MIPIACKRLAEVDFPIAVVSAHSALEKSIRHGHPSTLHLWWARRPLAACRAMLLALLLPDPADPHCPPEFRGDARRILLGKHGRPQGWTDLVATDEGLRKVLLQFIGEFADWDVATDAEYLRVGRALIRAAHGDEPPLVADPFAGGGSIPLEALRLGCDAFASDLNPVAVLINKVMLEDIPRHGPGLADELRRAGAEIKAAAEKELAEFYPSDTDGSRPIAYLWARTVRCEAPQCGAEIPLIRSFWLSKKAGRKRALRPIPLTPFPGREGGWGVRFEIFEPHSDSDVSPGTVSRARAVCLCCHSPLPPERVRAQLAAQRGGVDVIFDAKGIRTGGAFLLAVVTLRDAANGRQYRLPTAGDYRAVWKAQRRLAEVAAQPLPGGLSPVPDEPLPPIGTLGFRVQRYGMTQWGDLFTARQKLALIEIVVRVSDLGQMPVHTLLATVIGRCADYWSSGVVWAQTGEFVAHTFGRQALPIVWDFAEAVPWAEASGNLEGAIGWVARVVEAWPGGVPGGQVEISDATDSPIPDQASSCWFTDPPYYDAVPYADLSDFFFVWLKRALPGHPILRDPFDATNSLTPKQREAVQDEIKRIDGRPKDRVFFEKTMGKAFAEGRRVLRDDGIGCVVFAHKTTEGWEALLSGLVRGGWTITGSWPIATERPGRLRSQDSAALATSVHLICRPRPADADIGDWSDVLRALPKRVGDWMERLQSEGVAGADLVFACIGPALELYSQYAKVVDAEDREIPLGGDPEAAEPHRRGYLAYVWEVVGRAALEQVLGTAEARARNGAAGALEEDARLTALFLWTLQSTKVEAPAKGGRKGKAAAAEDQSEDAEPPEEDAEAEGDGAGRKKKGYTLVFDVARRFAQPLGIHLDDWEGRIIETDKGLVRLLPVAERAGQLFGDEGAQAVAAALEEAPERALQMSLFPDIEEDVSVRVRGRKVIGAAIGDDALQDRRGATTLDRVHAAMLLQSSGRANALRALLAAEQERGPDFLRLANSLSALYPRESEEKRLLDAMLLAVPK